MPDATRSGAGLSNREAAPGSVLRRKRRRQVSRRSGKVYAALDLGTNNCRLLIARPTVRGFRVIDSYSKVVRLGVGLASSQKLSQESMDRAVEAILICSKKMQAKSVKRWRCVATQACRLADNGEAFLKRVKSETGIALEVISPRVEARLSVMGCLNLVDVSKDVALVVDIGGGSTELSWVDVRRLRDNRMELKVHRPPISAWASLPVGVVTLSEQVDKILEPAVRYEIMKDKVRQAVEESGCESRFVNVFKQGQGHMIGTSGTLTSLAGIYQKLPYYQRVHIDGSIMPTQEAVDIAKRLALLSVTERAKEPCIGEDRAHLLVAGCAITDVLCELWPCEYIRVADRGLREGILMGLMGRVQKINRNGKIAYDETI